MGISRIATLRRDVAHRWELAATQITGTLHDVVRSVVLVILSVRPTWPAHNIGGSLGYCSSTYYLFHHRGTEDTEDEHNSSYYCKV